MIVIGWVVWGVVSYAALRHDLVWIAPYGLGLGGGFWAGVTWAEWHRAKYDLGHPVRTRKDHRKKNKNRSTTT